MTDRKLLQMALDAIEAALSDDQPYISRSKETVEALRSRLAQPEPEPVAWMEIEKYIDEDNLWDSRKILRDYDNGLGEPLYTAPPQREVYCGCGDEIVAGDGARCGMCVAVKYKEKEWQGLTDEEIIADDVLRYHFALNGGAGPISKKGMAVIAAVNAKLKEKNEN